MYETSFSGQLKPRWTRRRGMGWVWRREMRSSWSKASFKHCERHNYCIVIHGCHWTRVTGIYWWYESLSCSLNHPVDCSVKWSMFMLEVTLRRCKIVAIKGHKAFKQWLIGAGNTTHLTPWYWAWTVDVLQVWSVRSCCCEPTCERMCSLSRMHSEKLVISAQFERGVILVTVVSAPSIPAVLLRVKWLTKSLKCVDMTRKMSWKVLVNNTETIAGY